MKVVMDMVFNHTGNEHYLYKNKPDTNWFHQFDKFTRTNYRATAVMDPYASEYDKNLMQNGWFDKHMPDLNQQNKQVADYLIQNSIWWIESTGINGFRVDTWAYPDQDFMKKWNKSILNEYPQFTIFGEVWEHGPAIQAQFANNIYEGKNKGVMPGIIDFELYYAINDALTKDFGWTEGAAKIYYTLAQDFLYQNANKNVIFLDNHDLSRFSSMIEGNLDKFKSGIAFLFTTRGIPSMFYGTEILMKAWSNPDAKVRIDFPGGWPTDSVSKLSSQGRNSNENEAFEYIKKLAHYRRNCKAITDGKLIQFVPENGVYVYFRYLDSQKIMVIMNTSNIAIELESSRYKEMMKDYYTAKNVITDEKLENISLLKLKPKETLILELTK
jgi:glycosidase